MKLVLPLLVLIACQLEAKEPELAQPTLSPSKSEPEPARTPAPPPAPERARTTARVSNMQPLALDGKSTVADIVAQALPSVANVKSTRVAKARDAHESPLFRDPLFRRFFERGPFDSPPEERREMSLGSAVIVSADGVLLTNNHVVADATEVKVSLYDGRTFDADVIGTDPLSDLAVMKLKNPPKDLKPLAFGDSAALRLGDYVLAIGDPFGLGQTVTMGIVSAKGRADLGIVDYEDFIQTDAAINPGNSGGALVALDGKLVGVNTAILSRTGGYQGIGFAIPTEMAKPIMEQLLKSGKVVRGYLGVGIQDLTPELAEVLELDAARGVLVSDVMADGPAGKSGLQPRDVIVAVDGKEVTTAGRLRNEIAARGANTKVELGVLRDGKKISVPVTLGQLPMKATSVEEELAKDFEGQPEGADEREQRGLGLAVAPLTPEIRAQLDLPGNISGAVVTGVIRGSPAARAGLVPGDVITEANKTPIRAPKQLSESLKKSSGPVLLRIIREGQAVFVILEKPAAGNSAG